MPKIILKRMMRHDGVLQQKGTVLDVDQYTADGLVASGAADPAGTPDEGNEPAGTPEEDTADQEPEASEEPAAEPAEAPVEEPAAEPAAAPATPAGEMKRPAKGRDLATWQAYTQHKGVDPKGKTREELIGMWT